MKLADPDFGRPGRIDILLRIDVYGRRSGPPGSPIAFETRFGWVLAGRTNSHASVCPSIATHHVSVTSADDLLRKFWEIEESPQGPSKLSPDEQLVVQTLRTHTPAQMKAGSLCLYQRDLNPITWRVEISSCETISISRTFNVLERSIPGILHCNGGILQDESLCMS